MSYVYLCICSFFFYCGALHYSALAGELIGINFCITFYNQFACRTVYGTWYHFSAMCLKMTNWLTNSQFELPGKILHSLKNIFSGLKIICYFVKVY